MDIKEAIDICENSICDYVIGDYCCDVGCIDSKYCKDDCVFVEAIFAVTKHCLEQEELISKLTQKLEYDISKMDEKLKINRLELDDYRRLRIKAMRTKSKEILRILKGE